MNVPFYGHVRQYHNIKKEIDANITEVLESGQYVMGPMLSRFEKELAAYHGAKHDRQARDVGQRKITESPVGLDLRERHGPAELLDRSKIDDMSRFLSGSKSGSSRSPCAMTTRPMFGSVRSS